MQKNRQTLHNQLNYQQQIKVEPYLEHIIKMVNNHLLKRIF